MRGRVGFLSSNTFYGVSGASDCGVVAQLGSNLSAKKEVRVCGTETERECEAEWVSGSRFYEALVYGYGPQTQPGHLTPPTSIFSTPQMEGSRFCVQFP